jgi:hypothetical protein
MIRFPLKLTLFHLQTLGTFWNTLYTKYSTTVSTNRLSLRLKFEKNTVRIEECCDRITLILISKLWVEFMWHEMHRYTFTKLAYSGRISDSLLQQHKHYYLQTLHILLSLKQTLTNYSNPVLIFSHGWRRQYKYETV